MARVALQGYEFVPRARGGGVSGMDFDDEHEAFAASRSCDYIYESGNEAAFDVLDSHAETIEGDTKLPLVVTGANGCGKSALLANWVTHRRKQKHRDEFLFQHFVGCSPRSKQLAHLLHRLESALKDHFQLREMEVPASEERLRWSLNRFLCAAAKKQFPARIVIVMDAVNRLCGESSAADTLHWLPTDLPPGVRIIVSTVELEQNGFQSDDFYNEGSRAHRTYTELRRRKCPTIRLQSLSVEVRHQVISSFLQVNQQALKSLEQAQQFRLVTAKASSQPLFLRTILYALRLGFEMSDASIDHQIDLCLAAETSPQLIARVLDLSADYIDSVPIPASADIVTGGNPKTLTRILTALFASRHGLSDAEIWGIVELATNIPLTLEQRECIRRVLRDYTFSVNGLRSFSHEDYALVVYNEYISSPELHVRAHQLLVRYFSKLPPCDRKLDALPYHLEVSGSWTKLRTALVDVQMFRLWWTSAHKTEFLSLWASLTTCSNMGAQIRKLVTGEFDETMHFAQPPRPCLDIVEEYVRSVDDFKFVHLPSDDELASVILHVADFMLEFATLSLEEAADVPQFLHPTIPSGDLASLGVPFLSRDKDGNSVLNTPCLDTPCESPSLGGGKLLAMEIPTKMHEDIPHCSTYFYHRWMWIQFPWVSLANCGERFLKGVAHQTWTTKPKRGQCEKQRSNADSASGLKQAHTLTYCQKNASSTHAVTLPEIHKPQPSKTTGDTHIDAAPVKRKQGSAKINSSLQQESYVDHFDVQMRLLRANIGSYRSELDQLRQERIVLARVYGRTRDEMSELSKMHLSTNDLELRLDRLVRRLEQTTRGQKLAKLLYKNYECVKLMCERHPAHSQALINELEAKLKQDSNFIGEAQQRLRESTFESHDFAANNKVLQQAAQEMTLLQHDMLVQRIRQREQLQSMSVKQKQVRLSKEDAKRRRSQLGSLTKDSVDVDNGDYNITKQTYKQIEIGATLFAKLEPSESVGYWENCTDLVRKYTFIMDAKEFFGKFHNAQILQTQIQKLHDASEIRQRGLKKTLNLVEMELEQARYESQSIGSSSREARELQIRLSVQFGRHKHARETSLVAERLWRASFGGMQHICVLLGIAPPDQDTPVNEIIHQVEGVLEALMEEKDKTAQKLCDSHPPSNLQETSPAYDKLMRTPELDAALEQFEMPKARIANRLQAKPFHRARLLQQDIPLNNGETLSRIEVKQEA